MITITTTEVHAFSEAEEPTSVVVEAELDNVPTSFLYIHKVDVAADEEQDAVAKVVLEKILTPTQTTAKSWFQIQIEKPKHKSSVLVATFMGIMRVNAPMRQEVA